MHQSLQLAGSLNDFVYFLIIMYITLSIRLCLIRVLFENLSSNYVLNLIMEV